MSNNRQELLHNKTHAFQRAEGWRNSNGHQIPKNSHRWSATMQSEHCQAYTTCTAKLLLALHHEHQPTLNFAFLSGWQGSLLSQSDHMLHAAMIPLPKLPSPSQDVDKPPSPSNRRKPHACKGTVLMSLPTNTTTPPLSPSLLIADNQARELHQNIITAMTPA